MTSTRLYLLFGFVFSVPQKHIPPMAACYLVHWALPFRIALLEMVEQFGTDAGRASSPTWLEYPNLQPVLNPLISFRVSTRACVIILLLATIYSVVIAGLPWCGKQEDEQILFWHSGVLISPKLLLHGEEKNLRALLTEVISQQKPKAMKLKQ